VAPGIPGPKCADIPSRYIHAGPCGSFVVLLQVFPDLTHELRREFAVINQVIYESGMTSAVIPTIHPDLFPTSEGIVLNILWVDVEFL
jgi:hypothetical protein